MVADFVFKIPFFNYIVRLGGGIPANRAAAEAHLKAGESLALSLPLFLSLSLSLSPSLSLSLSLSMSM